MTAAEVRLLLRQACADAGSQQAWAKAHGVSGVYVSDVLAGRREPGEAILAGLGLRLVVSYEKTTAA
ncbi:transcriptional regulator [Aurantimonas sp. HBX-1]|uniref:transcriptional regulator n=1 Tax=Aurantimonas sp. HBX-1 TaxID=2906072 RepID=UPI001F27AF50|nr:transcriptional regulator [Aurantimonas sp. HBX-1]UIJ73475.1 transcriptional regulator [Aurantimonas sp. HBX-1]